MTRRHVRPRWFARNADRIIALTILVFSFASGMVVGYGIWRAGYERGFAEAVTRYHVVPRPAPTRHTPICGPYRAECV